MNAIQATTESAPDAAHESQAIDELASAPASELADEQQPASAEDDERATAAESSESDERAADAPGGEHAVTGGEEPSGESEGGEAGDLRPDRRKLEEQLEALKRKELELRRALMIADHPELAEPIRILEGRIYAIGRAEAKLAQGLSKAEARRRDNIEKKLASLREKRAELDTQIGALETELGGLGADRTQVYEAERREAVEQLLVALGTHEAAFRSAGIEASSLVPDLPRWLPEVEALAEAFVARRSDATAPEDAR